MQEPTKHFKNCLGVFQGGGCKALAFVGAYAETYDRGVFFSGLCGTSAGSIIAALVAAGATPEYLEEAVRKADFNSFKSPAKKRLFTFRKSLLMRTVQLHPLGRAALNLGLYSSEKLEHWLEAHLRALLGKTRTVSFSDLNIPLHVVATELGSSSPKVWSTLDTPKESVAFAVRCSCSIPVFFQPVNGTYVDGGVVSNLPAFALTQKSEHTFEKILCFAFDAEPPAPRSLRSPPKIELSPTQYLGELASAAVDGTVSIQNGLQRNLHSIRMGDLPLGTVDFAKVNSETIAAMFAAGRQAASDFFNSEIVNIKSAIPSRRVFFTEVETLNEVARYEPSNDDEIIILRNSNRWVYNLFPTLLHWTQRTKKVTFLRSDRPKKDEPHEKLRDLILSGLGSEVRATANLPFEGILIQRNGTPIRALNIISTAGSASPGFAATYDRECDGPAISLMLEKAYSVADASTLVTSWHDGDISVTNQSTDTIFERLKTVEQYASQKVTFQLENIDSRKVRFLTRFVKSYKYTQIRHMFELARSRQHELSNNLWIEYGTAEGHNFCMPVTPPIVEQHGDLYYLIEGNSRITYLLREERCDSIQVIVVRGVSEPLPASANFSADQILVSDEDRIGPTRYENFEYRLYREVEGSVRAPK